MCESHANAARSLAAAAGIALDASVVDTRSALEHACNNATELLLSFGTSVIVPAGILSLPKLLALNIHGASTDFPGRDPHHFAHYQRVRNYGATLHYMVETVDSGPIVDTELFNVADSDTPAALLAGADKAGIELMRRFFVRYARESRPNADPTAHWGSRKSTRRDFLDLCRVHCDMDEAEFRRRLEATAMPGYNNLYVDLHGYRFRLEGKSR